jgi:CheY-like chemotaxis protein
MHRAVKLALSRGDYEIVCCDNGSDALRISRDNPPAMLIADLDLPGVSGSELVKLIKADPKTSQTKIILLCSSIHQGDIGRLDQIPADARLWKPFESDAIFTLVQTLLRSLQSSRSSDTLSGASTQQFQRPDLQGEVTRPIQKASVLVDRTMPPHQENTRSSPTSRLQPFEEETSVKLNPKDASNNLWTSDFESTSTHSTEYKHAANNLEFDVPPPTDPSKRFNINPPIIPSSSKTSDNLSAYKEAQEWESIQARVKVPAPPSSSVKDTSQKDSGTVPQVNREEIRTMIRAEIQLSFDTWFREKLETKFQEILNQIETESKKRI